MIVFDLSCTCGYQFEGWFQDSEDFAKQHEAALIQCPVCGSDKVHKILSPVAVRTGSSRERRPHLDQGVSKEQVAEYFLRGLGNYVKENFEDVGVRLAEEALKIHYGVEENRKIRGVATAQEEEMLSKEGVDLVKIPLLTDNDSPGGKDEEGN